MKNLQYVLILLAVALIFIFWIGPKVFLFRKVELSHSLPATQADEAMYSCFRGNRNDELKVWERRLQDEIIQANSADEIFALIQTPGFYPFGGNILIILRARGKRGVITSIEDDARELYREMSTDELEELRTFIIKNSIDDLGEVIDDCGGPKCTTPYYYLHLKSGDKPKSVSMAIASQGGRSDLYHKLTELFRVNPSHKLIDLFHGYVAASGFKACYKMMDKFKGAEVLLADLKYPVKGVCKSGSALRTLIQTVSDQYPKAEWRDFKQGVVGEKIDLHIACPDIEIGKENDIPQGLDPYLYSKITTTLDGKWVVAEKNRGGPVDLIRKSLETGREYRINSPYLPERKVLKTISPFPSRNKMLVEVEVNHRHRDYVTWYLLVDPVTGANEKVTGEFRPIIRSPFSAYRTSQPLQPTGRPDEYWAAIDAITDERKDSTKIGRYDTRRFVFTPIIELPLKLWVDPSQFNTIWIDEAEGKIYLVYLGHLLRLPLKR